MDLPHDTIICGDCLEIMKDWPDRCVDAVVTDPPYGIKADHNHAKGRANKQHGKAFAPSKDYGLSNWDSSRPKKDAFQAMISISSLSIIFGGNYFSDLLDPSPAWICWDKDNGSNGYADFELAWTNAKCAARKVRWKWHGMLQEPGQKKDYRFHPTQKPLGLMLWVLKNYCLECNTILDPFCGSGTTCVAAKRLGMHYIGIDISEEYCKIARQRLAETDGAIFDKNTGEQIAQQDKLF